MMPNRRNGDIDRPRATEFSQLDESSKRMDDELLFRSATAQTTPQEDERLAEWLLASAENAQRFRDVVDVLRLTAETDDELTFGPAPSGEEILDGSREPADVGRGHGRTWRGLFLVAAAIATLAIGLPVVERLSDPEPAANSGAVFGAEEFVTETELATVGLRDGTVVRLAPETRLRVHESRDAREVSLAGRGYFAVAHDDAAPFTIRSDAGTVTVLGTRFDLTAAGEDLRLIVIEGRVRLTVRGSAVDVKAGQVAQVLKGNLVPPIDVPDPESLIQWVGDFIAFQSTPLRIVAREIEQRHGVRIEFSDPALADRTVTALFAGRSSEEITEVICAVANLTCDTVGDVVLRMSPAR